MHGEYIKNYFADTYKRVQCDVNDQSINTFLGDTATHPDVLASKLSEAERNELEGDLNIVEFDKAVE